MVLVAILAPRHLWEEASLTEEGTAVDTVGAAATSEGRRRSLADATPSQNTLLPVVEVCFT